MNPETNMDARVKLTGSEQREVANALRFLAIDAVEAANSGHPGMPMGMAEIAEVLWRRHLKHNPADPIWPDRDRFVLSNGHGSMLLYALLHLTGYALPMDELKRFRQLHSKTPGHPEVGITPGVETTTGPLGQGLANAVGMALSEQLLAAEFNRPGHNIVDHRTWVFVGDGCLMEGISHEACSLAGTLGLSKLIAVYDDNGISIDGHVEHWFADDTPKRFEAYGWRVMRDVDGHDTAAIEQALQQACEDSGRPTLVCCKTVIGKGSPNKAGTHDVHGAALGAAEAAATRAALGWSAGPFQISPEIRSAWDARAAGAARQADWQRRLTAYAKAHPQLAAEFERRVVLRALPANWRQASADALAKVVGRARQHRLAQGLAKRDRSVAAAVARAAGRLGRPDRLESHRRQGQRAATARQVGQPHQLRRARIRHERGHERHRAAWRLHTLRRNLPDVLGLQPQRGAHGGADGRARACSCSRTTASASGEDGPTHQPIEHVASLRLIPNNTVWRPCDAVETMIAWFAAIERRDGPTCLILSRQNLPHVERDAQQLSDVRRGGYVLAEAQASAAVTLLATGSEVALAMRAREALAAQGVGARVVSMPSCSDFDRPGRAVSRPGLAAQHSGAGHRGRRHPILACLYRFRRRRDRH